MLEFASSPVPMKVAAKVLKMNPDTIRDRMEDGTLNIGVIHIPVRRKTYKRKNRRAYISPKLFYEMTGFFWSEEKEKEFRGDKNEE